MLLQCEIMFTSFKKIDCTLIMSLQWFCWGQFDRLSFSLITLSPLINYAFMWAGVLCKKVELRKRDHSPWSVNRQSVKTHLLNFCLHLSLWRKKRFHVLSFVVLVCLKGEPELIPSLWGTGSCFFDRLPWRTSGGTVSSLLTSRALLIWWCSHGQRGQIRPKNRKWWQKRNTWTIMIFF